MVSVIIPVYNIPKKLIARCIRSLSDQTYKDFEVILVDDGSSDEINAFADRLGEADSRIKVFHRERGGVSAARNFGVEKATGEYLMFVDADDYVSPLMLEQAVNLATEHDADVVYAAVKNVPPVRHCKSTGDPSFVMTLEGENGMELLRRQMMDVSVKDFSNADGSKIHRGPCARLVRASIAKQVPFPGDIKWGEDVLWNYRLIDRIEKAVVTKSIWYYYVQYDRSATRGYDPEHNRQLVDFFDTLKKEVIAYHPYLKKNYYVALLQFFAIVLWNIRKVPNSLMSREDKEKAVSEAWSSRPFDELSSLPIFFGDLSLELRLIFLAMRIPRGFHVYYCYTGLRDLMRGSSGSLDVVFKEKPQ